MESSCEKNSLKDRLDAANADLMTRKANESSLAATCEELKRKLCESEKLRRYLHNTVQDLKVILCIVFGLRSVVNRRFSLFYIIIDEYTNLKLQAFFVFNYQ